MKPSLSCRPNQRVERRGTPFLLFIFLILAQSCSVKTPRHLTSLAQRRICCTSRPSAYARVERSSQAAHYRSPVGRLQLILAKQRNTYTISTASSSTQIPASSL